MFSTVIVYVINVPSFTTVPSVIELGFVVIAFVSTVFDDFSSELSAFTFAMFCIFLFELILPTCTLKLKLNPSSGSNVSLIEELITFISSFAVSVVVS